MKINEIYVDQWTGGEKMIKVTLATYEIANAWDVGRNRFMSQFRSGRGLGGTERSLDQIKADHEFGAACECAVFKALRLYWPATVDTYHDQPDGLYGIEVRGSRRDDGRLIVKRGDPLPHRYYFLVTGTLPTLRVVGWLPGLQCVVNREWLSELGEQQPAYFVPQSALISPKLWTVPVPEMPEAA